MKKQKFMALLLTTVILLSAIPLDMIFAHVGYEDNEDILFDFGADKFQYAYFETKATAGTGTTFRTIGWNLKFKGNSSSPWHEVCVDIDPDASKDIKYKLYLSNEGYVNNTVSDTEDGFKSYCIEDCVSSSDMDAYREVQYYGGEWEFNAIIQVYVNGVPQAGKIADNFDDAIALASWSTTTKNELHKFYYERKGTSKPEPIPVPDFTILYKGSIVNGKTVEKDMADLKIILEDKSTVPSTANPIEKRTWYYWDIAGGWTEISGTGENDTAVTINNCDTDLVGSKPLKKAFRLDVEDNYGYVYSVSGLNYEVGFTVSTGTINIHYIDTGTGNAVFPDETINNVPFGTPKTITNTKATPEGMNLLTASPQTVTLSASNPIADVYFLYAPVPPVGEEQGMITVYYKDKVTKQDISQPDVIAGDYGTYQVDAMEITGYTLDSTTPSPVSVTTSAANSKPAVTFLYNAPVPKRPPVAIIDAPDMAYAGDNFHVSGKDSYDPDGHIDDYQWDYDNDITGNTIGNDDDGYIWMPYGSSGLVKLQVTDNDGLTDSDRKYVDLLPPVPIAKIGVSGILKVNRKVTLSALSSIDQDHYPIDHSRDTWAIQADSSILKYSGTLTGSTKDILVKAPVNLPTTLQVYNTCIDAEHPDGFSDTDSTTLKIVPDLAPNAGFSIPSVVTRNPSDSKKATITVTNTSSSPDGDIISKAVAMYAYDSDNDGNFEEETWYYSKDGINWLPVGMTYSNMVTSFNIFSISASNPANFKLKTNQVGKYRFEMRVMEDIPESQTISSFITESDYRRNDTFTTKPIAEKIVEVQNIAPSANFEVKKNIPMDLVVVTDYLGALYDSLVSKINTFKTQLIPLGINPAVTYITDRKAVGERTVYQYEWNRMIKFYADGWATNARGDFPYHNEFTISLESVFFNEGEENLPDRSKYAYHIYCWKYEDEDNTGDPEWWLGVEYDIYYDGQYQKTYDRKFQLGHGQCYNGLGTWFNESELTSLDNLKITIDTAYTNVFKKGSRTVSGYKIFEGLDVDKVMNVNTPSNNRYLTVAADSCWNTMENNSVLKNFIETNGFKAYLVADSTTLNKLFTITDLDDIRYINGAKAYEKDGKLYQYSGAILNELPYAARVYPLPVQSVSIPMQNYTVKHYKSDGDHESKVIQNEHYTTTIAVANGSVTVNSTTINGVKGMYSADNYYFIEKTDGSIYYFKRYLNYWKQTLSSTYIHQETKLSNPVLLSGASGIKSLKSIGYLDIIDYVVRARYTSRDFVNVYLQDKNNNVFTAKSGEIYKMAGIMSGDYYFYSCSYPTALTDMSLLNTDALDLNPVKTGTTFHYYDIWGDYRELPKDVVTVQYAMNSEKSLVYKTDSDVKIYSTKELIPLKSLYDGINGGIYAAHNYGTALDDIAKDIKATTSTLTNYYLVNEQVNYTSLYSDYESDPQYASRWMFTHDAGYFDNSNGAEPNSGKYITSPINPFTKVGKYEVTLQVRDNPKNDLRFLNDTNESYNYYEWSSVMDKLILYVHRKPAALQKITIANNGNGTYTVRAYDAGSYDPDHSVTRADKGIVSREWRWKESTGTNWHTGQMNKSDCTPDKSYITQLRVKDLEGVWSDYNTITIDKDNPPVALFTIDKCLISTAELLKVKDQSFPQSFSSIVKWNWIVKKYNTDGTLPTTNIQNSTYINSNNGTGTMAGYDINVKTNYSTNGAGKYKIYLRVKDSSGLWSDGGIDAASNLHSFYSQDFTVDKPPTADFVIEKTPINVDEILKLKDQSTSTGVSPITKWHWIVKKLNTDGSVPSTNIQDAIFADSNTGTGSMAGYDVNVKTLYADKGAGTYRIYLRVMNGSAMWSDGGTESSYNLDNFFHRDLEVQESFIMSNFRVVKIRDLHLEPYYYVNGTYPDRPFYVNDMAIDPSNFIIGGVSPVPDFDSLTKGYRFEYEIDTTNFNEADDTIVITPAFFSYTTGVPGVRGEETDLYWEDSDKNIYKAGEGAHSRWAAITLDSGNRTIKEGSSATWRGEYFIPATSWQVPSGTSAANAKSNMLNADIIVNFSIKGYKDGVMKYDYNLQQWPAERTIEKYPYEIGDVIRYDYTKSSLDDINIIINRP